MVDAHHHEFPVLSTIMNKLNQRERLFLAALCHDIGKGSSRDHSEVGGKIALSLCRRLGMNDYDARFVSWLVRNHLIMSFTAQREDTSDPRVIDRFAERVGDQEHLDNLYLLTVADIRGTSHSLWNEWKGSLLSNLYTATSRRIRAGIAGTLAISQRIADRKQTIRKLLQDTVSRNRLDGLWKQLDQEYFLRNSPITCAWHATEICNTAPSDLPLVSTRYRSEIKAEQILIVTPDTEDLLVRATGAIDNLRLDILDARIHRTLSDLGILIFIVTGDRVELVSSPVFDYHKVKIENFLMKPYDNYQPVSVSLPRALKQFKVPTTVTFSDNEEFRHTTMEVTSQDRPSLLFNVSRALLKNKVRLLSAKVSTLGGKADDTFFITDRDGHPISGQIERVRLESRIKELLD